MSDSKLSWPENEYTPIEDIPSIISAARKTFRTGLTLPLSFRRNQLYALARLVQDNASSLADALHADLGRPKTEAYMAELLPLVKRSLLSAERLEGWIKEEDVSDRCEIWQRGWKARVRREPRGVGLVIAPWNYPIILSLQPLMGAISAGCCAILKLSEISPHTSSLLAKLIPKYLDQRAYRAVLGGVKEVGRVLEEKFDHIFYTGNSQIARIISVAAAKHLTPLTLELGGKSPVLIDPEYDLGLAVKRAVWGKCNNAGQICVAPDYVLLPVEEGNEGRVEEFVRHFKGVLNDFFPDGALESKDYSTIVSQAHFDRLMTLLRETKGTVLAGGQVDEPKRRIEPTLVLVEDHSDVLLQGELFGPILPLVLVKDVYEGIEYIRDRDHPLVLYAFTENDELKETILQRTMSGAVSFNDTFGQLAVDEVPFGGVGESGYGRQVLKATFDAFSYERGISDVPASDEQFFGARYPPFTEDKLAFFMAGVTGIKIPDDTSDKVNGTGHANGIHNGNGNGVEGEVDSDPEDKIKKVQVDVGEVDSASSCSY